ncbi:phosphatidylinositol phosphatase PTPRQ, partial [Nephila pilipes]
MPKNIRAEDVTNTSAFIFWDEPYPVRGLIEFYLINWQEAETSDSFQNTTVETYFIIDDLIPSRMYSIQVKAKTNAGFGNWSEPVTVWTMSGLPMVPRNVKLVRSAQRSLEVSWDEPQPFRGEISSYTVRWGEKGSTNSSFEIINGTSYVIKRLFPYTLYLVEVQASTEAGDSDWSRPVEGRTAVG